MVVLLHDQVERIVRYLIGNHLCACKSIDHDQYYLSRMAKIAHVPSISYKRRVNFAKKQTAVAFMAGVTP